MQLILFLISKFRCPNCLAEITFKTDLENCDYQNVSLFSISHESYFPITGARSDSSIRGSQTVPGGREAERRQGRGRKERPHENARETNQDEQGRNGSAR